MLIFLVLYLAESYALFMIIYVYFSCVFYYNNNLTKKNKKIDTQFSIAIITINKNLD